MTNVWVLNDFVHGDVSLWSDNTDPTEIPHVKEELGYLEGGYEDEREDFLNDLDRAIARGRGEATIEERLSLSLETVREG